MIIIFVLQLIPVILSLPIDDIFFAAQVYSTLVHRTNEQILALAPPHLPALYQLSREHSALLSKKHTALESVKVVASNFATWDAQHIRFTSEEEISNLRAQLWQLISEVDVISKRQEIIWLLVGHWWGAQSVLQVLQGSDLEKETKERLRGNLSRMLERIEGHLKAGKDLIRRMNEDSDTWDAGQLSLLLEAITRNHNLIMEYEREVCAMCEK